MNGLFHEVSGHQDGIEGTEKNGLTNPQEGRADSLNLAIATAVMLYEARRHLLKLDRG